MDRFGGAVCLLKVLLIFLQVCHPHRHAVITELRALQQENRLEEKGLKRFVDIQRRQKGIRNVYSAPERPYLEGRGNTVII